MVGLPIKINPLDRQARKAVGIGIPFSNSGVFNSTFTSKDAIKANLLNFFLTGENERYFNTLFGAGITNLLFENISEEQLGSLKEVIYDKITFNFPTLLVKEISFTSNPDTNTINFKLVYSIKETNVINEEINVEILT